MLRISFVIGVAMVLATTVSAQRPNERQGPPGAPPGGFPPGPPGFHLMTALDANRDGKLSAKEIENAAVALNKLDKNKDGKLSPEEIGWPPSFGGGPPGFGGGRGGFPGFGGSPDGGRPQRPPLAEERADNQSSTGTPRGKGFFTAEQLKRLDRNDDGKITKEDIPARMRELILSRVDTNKDGVIDEQELNNLTKAPFARSKSN